jgi:hypothetical protein
MSRLNRRSVQSLCFAFASVVAVAGCSGAFERGSLLPTETVPVALLDLPDDYVAPGAGVPVVLWDLPADYVAPSVASYDAAALDVPAPITVVEG